MSIKRLESTAKTLAELQRSDGSKDLFFEKWVPLEEAQKELIEYRRKAGVAHQNAQWTMDANRRQVINIRKFQKYLYDNDLLYIEEAQGLLEMIKDAFEAIWGKPSPVVNKVTSDQ